MSAESNALPKNHKEKSKRTEIKWVARKSDSKHRKSTNQSPFGRMNQKNIYPEKRSSQNDRVPTDNTRSTKKKKKLTASEGRNHFIIPCLFCINAHSSHSFLVNGMTDEESDLILFNRIRISSVCYTIFPLFLSSHFFFSYYFGTTHLDIAAI